MLFISPCELCLSLNFEGFHHCLSRMSKICRHDALEALGLSCQVQVHVWTNCDYDWQTCKT